MIILGIETSCDETAVAIVQDGKKIIASNIATSLAMHAETGGIIPERAAREQILSIVPTLDKTLSDSRLSTNEIDAIAVTVGPGLIGSLLVGVETAKTLATLWNKPLIPVNHLVAHLYACFVNNQPEFPAVGLVVSGGHTDFVYMKDEKSIEYVGGTRDDAAGEAFDKCARIIGLGYPGGPAIAAASLKFTVHKSQKLDLFPRPMIDSKNLDMSFSGLKTSVSNYIKDNPDFDKEHLAAQIQEAIVVTIVEKSRLAISYYKPKSFIVSGGVSANMLLRAHLTNMRQNASEQPRLYVPETNLSTDNAVMIATAAFYNYRTREISQVIANPSLAIDQ